MTTAAAIRLTLFADLLRKACRTGSQHHLLCLMPVSQTLRIPTAVHQKTPATRPCPLAFLVHQPTQNLQLSAPRLEPPVASHDRRNLTDALHWLVALLPRHAHRLSIRRPTRALGRNRSPLCLPPLHPRPNRQEHRPVEIAALGASGERRRSFRQAAPVSLPNKRPQYTRRCARGPRT